MTLAKRLAKLEQARGTDAEPELELDLPPDLRERVEASYAAGHGLEGLSFADKNAVIAAYRKVRGE